MEVLYSTGKLWMSLPARMLSIKKMTRNQLVSVLQIHMLAAFLGV